MSWSVNFIGTPDKITAALKKQSESLSGKSKEEFDAALPNIAGILALNHNKTGDPVLRLIASGHAHDGYSTCGVNIEFLNGALV